MRLHRSRLVDVGEGEGDKDRRRAYVCHDCPASRRTARQCPKLPSEWRDLANRAGIHLPREPAHQAAALGAWLKDSRPPGEGASSLEVAQHRQLVGEAREVREQMATRAHIARRQGVPWGEDPPGVEPRPVCPWFRAERDSPGLMLLLSQVRLGGEGARVWWVQGAVWDQPAVLVDAQDAILAEHHAIDDEQMQAMANKGKGDAADG